MYQNSSHGNETPGIDPEASLPHGAENEWGRRFARRYNLALLAVAVHNAERARQQQMANTQT